MFISVDRKEKKTSNRGRTLCKRTKPKTYSIPVSKRARIAPELVVSSICQIRVIPQFCEETEYNNHYFFLFKVLKSLSHHGLKYLDISECSNITSKQLATLLTQQPNIEQLSLQGTCQMPATLEVFRESRLFITRLR